MLRGIFGSLLVSALVVSSASASVVRSLSFTETSGLKAAATFTFDPLTPNQLAIKLANVSTSLPGSFDSADMLLTSISFKLPTGVNILSGGAFISAGSNSVNFSTGYYGPGSNVSPEWGYGNGGTTGLMSHFVTAMQAGSTKFAPGNLDGPVVLDGPQGGLVADPFVGNLGGLGAIRNSIDVFLTLSSPLSNLNFLDLGAIVEWGSDAEFTTVTLVPAPAAALLALMGLGAAAGAKRFSIR